MYNFSPLFRNSIFLCNHQTIRWMSRKPFWLGVAKTKISKVPQKIHMPENEYAEYLRLVKEYSILERSVLEFIKSDRAEEEIIAEVEDDKELQKKIEESLKLNNMWNSEIAAKRNERMQIALNSKMEHIQEEKNISEEETRQLQLRVDEIVRQEIENSKTFVTYENLNQKIEESLHTCKDYNFAIDIRGKIYDDSESHDKQKTHSVEIYVPDQ